ncbi:tyrosine-type recombinase/integrase [Persephonella sp.]
MKISECVELYLSYISDKSEHTVKNYRVDLYQFISIVGDKEINDISKSDIAKFRMVLQSGKRKSSTIARKLASVNSFFEYLIDLELISSSPVSKSHRPKVSQKIPPSLSNDEINRIISSCKTLLEKTVLTLMITTGIRSSELLSIKKEDILLEKEGKTFALNNNSELDLDHFDIAYIKIKGKGDKERIVPISGKPLDIFLQYLKNSGSNDYLFPFSYHTLRRMIINIGRRSSIPLHPHKLRHTAATIALKSGAELRVIQELLGHASPLTTARYAKVGHEQLIQATRTLSESLDL